MGDTVEVGIAKSPEEDRRQRFFVHLRQDGGDPSQLLDLLATVVDREDWTRLLDDRGAKLNFRRYITEPYPVGIGWSLDDVQTILKLHHKHERPPHYSEKKASQMEQMRATVDRLLTEPLPRHGEVGRGRNRVDNINSIPAPTEGGTSAEYLKSRLARDAPEVLEQLRAGEFKSVRAAAKAAGIVKEPTRLEILKKTWTKADADERLRFLEWVQAME